MKSRQRKTANLSRHPPSIDYAVTPQAPVEILPHFLYARLGVTETAAKRPGVVFGEASRLQRGGPAGQCGPSARLRWHCLPVNSSLGVTVWERFDQPDSCCL